MTAHASSPPSSTKPDATVPGWAWIGFVHNITPELTEDDWGLTVEAKGFLYQGDDANNKPLPVNRGSDLTPIGYRVADALNKYVVGRQYPADHQSRHEPSGDSRSAGQSRRPSSRSSATCSRKPGPRRASSGPSSMSPASHRADPAPRPVNRRLHDQRRPARRHVRPARGAGRAAQRRLRRMGRPERRPASAAEVPAAARGQVACLPALRRCRLRGRRRTHRVPAVQRLDAPQRLLRLRLPRHLPRQRR
jgi:hypothetical protein